MPLIIENIPDQVVQELAEKAKASGRSVGDEAAAILTEAVSEPPAPESMDHIQRMVWTMYRGKLPHGISEELIRERLASATLQDPHS